jgi:hypothetical protein
MIQTPIIRNFSERNIFVDRWEIINYIVNDNDNHYHIEY